MNPNIHSFINEMHKDVEEAKKAEAQKAKKCKKCGKEKCVCKDLLKKVCKKSKKESVYNKDESIFVLASLEKLLSQEGEGYKNGMIGAIDVIKNNGPLDAATAAFMDDFLGAIQKSYGKKSD